MPETGFDNGSQPADNLAREPSENLGAITHPLLPEWMEGYKWANEHYPQVNLAIHIQAANSFLKSFQAKEVDWMYAAHSGFSDEQLAEIKSMLNDRHRAFGIEKYPREHIREGEESFVVKDQTIRDIWTNMVGGVAFTILDFAGGWDPENNPEHKRMIDKHESHTPPESDNRFIADFFANEANAEKVAQLTALYTAADASLRLPETRTLAAHRKSEFNQNRTAAPPAHEAERITIGGYPVPYVGLIRQAVSKGIRNQGASLQLPDAITREFVDNVARMSN